MKAHFSEIISTKLVQMFVGDTKLKTIDPPLTEREIPIEFII